MQLRGGLLRADGHGALQQHVAGVQSRVHLHDGHAGLGVARLDGALDGRRATPARQQAGVDVQAAQARQVQRPLRQDQAVGGHHHDIRRHALQLRARGGRLVRIAAVEPQAARLGDPDAGGQGRLLDRTGRQFQAAASRPVGLGQHQRHVVAGGKQRIERDTGEFGSAGENKAHGTVGNGSGRGARAADIKNGRAA